MKAQTPAILIILLGSSIGLMKDNSWAKDIAPSLCLQVPQDTHPSLGPAFLIENKPDKSKLSLETSEQQKMKTQIIYLNGPSSSGKSTLAKALQDVLEQPFLHVGIDQIISMMPNKINNWVGGSAPLGFSWQESLDQNGNRIQNLQVGPFARKVSDTFPEIVLLLAKLGHFIIVDDVAIGQEQFKRWKAQLQDFSVLYVGIRVPLEILELREKQRGDRILGSSRAQFNQVHTDNQYDLELDTSVSDLAQCVDAILSRIR